MSLAIDVDRVEQVLLLDGKWHEVARHTFEIDAYEYVRAKEFKIGEGDAGMRFGGGQEKQLVPAAGARWVERDINNVRTVFCAINAIQAVSYGWAPTKDKKSN